MRIISRIAVLAIVALVVAASVQPASATCAGARLVGGCGGGGCKYIYIGQQGTAPNATLDGNFWGVGGGNPAVGPGDDNGTDEAQGNVDNGIDWIKNAGGLYYLAGAWSNAFVDGCVDNATTPNPKRTAVALSQAGPSQRPNSTKQAGYFAVLCQLADSGLNYDFSLTQGQHVLAPIPYPSVTGSGGTTAQIAPPSPAALSAGTYALDGSCTGLIRGYKTCTILGTSDPASQDRLTGGWVCGAETPIASPSTVPTPPCGSNQLLYVATSLVFESGFETQFVSENTKISCGLSADRPSNFKLIKKPKTTPQR